MPTLNLVEHIDRAIEAEGLYTLIPSDERKQTPPAFVLAIFWMVLLVVMAALPVLVLKDLVHFGAALLANALFVLVTGFLLANFLFGRRLFTTVENNPEELEMLVVVLSSAGVAAVAGKFVEPPDTVLSVVAAALLSAMVLLAIAFLSRKGQSVHTTFGALRLALKMAKKSFYLLAVLMPLSLAVVLFTIFSDELWDTIRKVEPGMTLFVVLLIFGPAFLLGLTSLNQYAKAMIAPLFDPRRFTPENLGSRATQSELRDSARGIRLTSRDLEAAETLLGRQDCRALQAQLEPVLRRRAKAVLILLLFFSTAILLSVLAVYFFALFTCLFGWELLPWQSAKETSGGPHLIWKVSVVLAAFVTSLSTIQALNDHRILRNVYETLLSEELERWMIVGALYLSMLNPKREVRQENTRPAVA